ncbi:MAG: heme-binding protein [candidate division NC10 bacterium]|nr:heme-binding protein [candidate division NC10 bacterium]
MKKSLRSFVGAGVVLALAFAIAHPSSAQLKDKKTLTLEAAKKVAAAAELEAIRNGWKLNIAVVDDGANLVYFQRMDDAFLGSIEVAIRKAATAVFFQRPTKALQDIARPDQRAYGIQHLDRVIILEGGLPISVGGTLIGGCGASGARGDQDAQACQAGIDALMKDLGQ